MPRTSSSVPASIFDTRGRAPIGVYSIATRPDTPSSFLNLSIMSSRLTNNVVSSPSRVNRLWSTKLTSIRGRSRAGIHIHTGRVTWLRSPPTVSPNIGFSPR